MFTPKKKFCKLVICSGSAIAKSFSKLSQNYFEFLEKEISHLKYKNPRCFHAIN
jgi:hypothetical protein